MANKCFPLVRGRVMRATRLDACGRIADHACSAIATEGFVSVALTANIDEGEEINVTNASGRTCVKDTPDPTFTGYGVAITFCDVDPQLYAMMTNQSVVFDADGDAVGFRVNSKVRTGDANFALEVWSNVPGVVCDDPNAAGSYGYTLLPFIKGGVLGDFTIENSAVTFTLQNAATKDGNAWAEGPYDVTLDDASALSPLLEPLDAYDHLHVQYTTVAPPEPGCTCAASGPPATGATAGIPATLTPADSYAPLTLVDLLAAPLTADPLTAWTTGQHMVLGDNTHAYWNSTAWVAGDAP